MHMQVLGLLVTASTNQMLLGIENSTKVQLKLMDTCPKMEVNRGSYKSMTQSYRELTPNTSQVRL